MSEEDQQIIHLSDYIIRLKKEQYYLKIKMDQKEIEIAEENKKLEKLKSKIVSNSEKRK